MWSIILLPGLALLDCSNLTTLKLWDTLKVFSLLKQYMFTEEQYKLSFTKSATANQLEIFKWQVKLLS